MPQADSRTRADGVASIGIWRRTRAQTRMQRSHHLLAVGGTAVPGLTACETLLCHARRGMTAARDQITGTGRAMRASARCGADSSPKVAHQVFAVSRSDLLGRADADEAAVHEDAQAVAQHLRLLHRVRRQHDGPAGASRLHDVPQVPPRSRVQPLQRGAVSPFSDECCNVQLPQMQFSTRRCAGGEITRPWQGDGCPA